MFVIAVSQRFFPLTIDIGKRLKKATLTLGCLHYLHYRSPLSSFVFLVQPTAAFRHLQEYHIVWFFCDASVLVDY